jgi:hypothetical protein
MRAEEQAKARSDEIDLYLKEDAKGRCNVLLMRSCPHPAIHWHETGIPYIYTDILTASIY